MSKQWGHGFHAGQVAQVNDALKRRKEYGIDRWVNNLRSGGRISRRDWDIDQKHIFMTDGALFLFDAGDVSSYQLTEIDLRLEWFGFFDLDCAGTTSAPMDNAA